MWAILPGQASVRRDSQVSGGVLYLLNDQFTTVHVAPLVTPRTSEPGPGVLQITDASSVISIASDKLVVSPIAMGADSGYITTQFSRTAGLATIFTFGTITTPANVHFGWAATLTSSLRMGFTYGGSLSALAENPSSAAMPTFSSAPTAHAFVEYATGGAWFARIAGTWELIWRYTDDTTATMGAVMFLNHFFLPQFELDTHIIRLLPAPFDTTYGISTFTSTTLVTLDSFTGVADALISFEFALSGTPALNDIVGFKYRVQDANNYWYAYLKWSGTQWDVFLDSVATGVPTNRLTVAAVGTPNMLRVSCKGTKHDLYTRAVTSYTKRGAQANLSLADTQTTIQAIAAAGTTLTRLTCDPRVAANYTTELDRT